MPPDTCSVNPGCGGEPCPVNLANGGAELMLSFLQTPHGSFDLSWYNLYESGGSPTNPTQGLGPNWISAQFASIVPKLDETLVANFSPSRGGRVFWFHDKGEDEFGSCFNCNATLSMDDGDYRLTEANGSVTVFDGTYKMIKEQITPGGQSTLFTFDGGSGHITEMSRTFTEGEAMTIESRAFTYNDGRLQYVMLRRATDDTLPISWTNVRRLELVYYEEDVEGEGNEGDLKFINEQLYVGGNWTTDKTTYFLYYTDDEGEEAGYQYGLKYMLSPAGYQRFSDAVAPDIADYAQVYYEYDEDRRVVRADTEGGQKRSDISYEVNTDLLDFDNNNWYRKAVMANLDDSVRTVYSNHIGQDLLVDIEDVGENHWITYIQYNHRGRVVEETMPSAIDMSGTAYDDAYDNLAVQREDHAGLIRLTTYYENNDGGGAPGRVEYTKVKNGVEEPPVNLTKTEYVERKINPDAPDEVVIYPVSKQIVYRSDTVLGGDPIETLFDYTAWHDGTVQPETVTITLPVVPDTENGDEATNEIVQEFDVQGRLTQVTDARGTITGYLYDNVTGARTQMVQDTTGLELTTDYTLDDLGRTIKVLGPEHNVDGQMVRTVTWIIYQDVDNQVWTGQGYKWGSSSYALINPVTIRNLDDVESAGELDPSNAEDLAEQDHWVRWTHNVYDEGGRLTATQVYFDIPDDNGDPGDNDDNFDETLYGYDDMGRQNRVESPAGTISGTLYDARGNVLSVSVGTDDTGGGGHNMKVVVENEYDDGEEGGDGTLTQVTRPVDASNSGFDRVTQYQYDWRDRLEVTTTNDGATVVRAIDTLDNLGRVILREEKRDAMSTLTLIGKSQRLYDTRGRVYRTLVFAVNGSGTAGNSLANNVWYDAGDNVIKSQPSGSQAFTKTTYDAVGRPTVQSVGYYEGSGDDDPTVLTNNVIFEQTLTQYDDAGNALLVTSKQRFHDAMGTGALNGPASSQPKSRDSYLAMWYDGIGRQTQTADYGTYNNNGTPPGPPTSAPSPSDTVLVSETVYNARGEAEDQIDPAGKTTRSAFDDAGRITEVARNYDNTPTEVVQTLYTKGRMTMLVALNEDTGDGSQETEYDYGSLGGTSKIASNDLLHTVTYPDTGVVTYGYNLQGERIYMADQNGSAHSYEYDKLGRMTRDRGDAGEDVDSNVLRIDWGYDNRRRLSTVTSHYAGGGTANQVQFVYNDFSQVINEYQEHSRTVNTGTSPRVQYAYEDGSANTTRRTRITYPAGQQLNYVYGSADSVGDLLSRVQQLTWASGPTTVAEYTYLGLGSCVRLEYTQPDVCWDLITGAGANLYAGFDLFGRTLNCLWQKCGGPSSSSSSSGFGSSSGADYDALVHLTYGYNRVSNRRFRYDHVAHAAPAAFDDLYGYDDLHRLINYGRGTLNLAGTSLTTATLTQSWNLDDTGNWKGFGQGVVGTLTQTRTHNTANEITAIAKTVGSDWDSPPGYDDNGNMTKFPQPGSLGDSYTAVWDAWNRLVKILGDDGTTVIAQYEYDGLNRRIVKMLPTEARHAYYSDQWQVLEERVHPHPTSYSSSSSSSSGAEGVAQRQFVWGLRYVDDLVLRDRDSDNNGSLNERIYALQDDNWNVVALCSTTGIIAERYAYTPYGESQVLTPEFANRNPSSYNWEYRFTGRELDQDTKLQINRNRYLHHQLGRWISRDPIGYDAGDVNLYQYVGGKPTNAIDPIGFNPVSGSPLVWPFRPGDIPSNAPPGSDRPPLIWPFNPGDIPVPQPLPPGGTPSPVPKPANPLGPLAGYGKYCGVTRIANCNAVDKPSPSNKPIDDIDRACMVHDCCLFTWKEYINPCREWTCNRAFCRAVREATCLNWATSKEIANCEAARLLITLAYCDPDLIITPGNQTGAGPFPR
jgi:RHS repeat-associated protein